MKTKLKKLVSILFFATVIVSCSKDNDKPEIFVTEDFMNGYLTTSGFAEKTLDIVNDSDYETGLEFTPLVKGKITALKVKLPAANTALKVTIWDAATATVLRTERVNVAIAGTETILDIADLELAKDKKYAITMNTNDWYFRNRSDYSNATYPITSGNIRIDGFKWNSGTSQTYPTESKLNFYRGDVRFDFLQTE